MHQPAARPQQRSIAKALPLLFFAFLALAFTGLHAKEGAAIHKGPPVFPTVARQKGAAGTLIVTVTDASGKTAKAESSSSSKLLVTSAIDAVKQSKFAPGDGPATFPASVNLEKTWLMQSPRPSPAETNSH